MAHGNANIIKPSGAVVAGDMVTTEIAFMIYSVAATAFILLNPSTASSGGGASIYSSTTISF